MNLHDWQKVSRQHRGIKKGEVVFTVLKSRHAGKTTTIQRMMRYTSSWTKWEPEWTWSFRKSSRSGKMIWGRIMVRTSKFMVSGRGKLVKQRASPKEAYTQQKEAFKKALS